MTIRPLEEGDADAWARMRHALWPDCPPENSRGELPGFLDGRDEAGQPCAAFVAVQDGVAVGFVEATLRPTADGCSTTPVGFLEGWYVEPEHRRTGVGRALARAAEHWARGRGCTEMASDTDLANLLSQEAHGRLGYAQVERVVRFRKDL